MIVRLDRCGNQGTPHHVILLLLLFFLEPLFLTSLSVIAMSWLQQFVAVHVQVSLNVLDLAPNWIGISKFQA